MAKLVDARDLKSLAVRHAGSNPAGCTIQVDYTEGLHMLWRVSLPSYLLDDRLFHRPTIIYATHFCQP